MAGCINIVGIGESGFVYQQVTFSVSLHFVGKRSQMRREPCVYGI
jgi:hypothetical protein